MRINQKITLPALFAAALLGLSGCGGVSITGPGIADSGTAGQSASAGGSAPAAPIQVNAYLWRATLDTLSFMPMASADPFGGVIITDWYTPPNTPNERFKVNAYILGRQLTANAIQVSVFHQEQSPTGWAEVPSDPAVASGLVDRILARAADLQVQAANSK